MDHEEREPPEPVERAEQQAQLHPDHPHPPFRAERQQTEATDQREVHTEQRWIEVSGRRGRVDAERDERAEHRGHQRRVVGQRYPGPEAQRLERRDVAGVGGERDRERVPVPGVA